MNISGAAGRPFGLRFVQVAMAAILALVTGCSALPRATGAAATYPGGADKLAQGEQAVAAAGQYSIRGIVDWPQASSAQAYRLASINADVQTQNATVALIELGSGITVGTGWTNGTGAFTINTGAYVPQVNAFYIVEAIKGLGAQLPGNAATRLRTIMQWTGTAWISITNASSGGQIAVDQLTTALALEVGLGNMPAASVIGTVVETTSPPQLTSTVQSGGIDGHSATEIDQLSSDVKNFILNSPGLDPVSQVDAVTPTLFTVSPVEGSAGQVIVLNGSGFVPISGETSVYFSGASAGQVTAPILAMTPTQIYAQIPNGSVTGAVQVGTSQGKSGSVPFAVANGSVVTISTVTPNPVSLGNTITILGTNFVTPAANNNVTFQITGGGTATVAATSGDSASLAVTIPQDAVSGLVYVSNAIGASNNFFLSVSDTGIPTINTIFPTEGVSEQDVLLNGILFGNTPGTVTVTDIQGNPYPAQIRYWRDNQVRFTVPWQVGMNVPVGGASVSITIYNAAQQAATQTWTTLSGQVENNSWTAFSPSLPNSGVEIVPFWSGQNLYLAGGGGGSNVASVSLSPNGGPVALTPTIATLPITTSSPDGHSHYNTWLGDRYWIFDNNGGAQKCYIQFDPQGNYVTAVNVSPSFQLLNGQQFFQHDTSICGGPHGIYMAGSDDQGIPVWDNLIYALLDPDNDTVGPWQSVPLPGDVNMSNAIDTQDNGCVVLQNNLWRFGYDNVSGADLGATGVGTAPCGTGCSSDPYYGNGHQEVCPLNADGSPVQAGSSPDGSPFYFAGPSPSPGTHFMGDTVPIGPYLYNFEPDWHGCLSQGDTEYYSTLVSGTYPADAGTRWSTAAENVAFQDTPDTIVVGAYVYVVGGCGSSNNVLYYTQIQ